MTTTEPMRYWLNIKRTPVIAELVALAAERSDVKVEYRDQVGQYHDMDRCDAAEAYDNGYNPDMLKDTHGSLWEGDYKDKTGFWLELNRLQELVTEPLNEPILDDDHPVYQGYFYVVNGKVREFIDGMNMTVRRWKALRIKDVPVVNEVRRCDMGGRIARQPLKKEPEKQMKAGWDQAGRGIRQAKRRPRSSNKIKKVRHA